MSENHAALAAPERLRSLFHPRSIALVGATDNSRWSLNTFQNLHQFQCPGPVYCVHPTRAEVHGEKAFPRLDALPSPPDLVYVMVSTARVLAVLEEAADLGMRHAIVLTAGFGEVGEEGKTLERALQRFAHERDMTIVGPNGNGFIHAHCTHCTSTRLSWKGSDGRVYSYTVIRQHGHQAFRVLVPFVVAFVDLDEGFRMLSHIVEADPAHVCVGQVVEVVFQDLEDVSRPVFRPVAEIR